MQVTHFGLSCILCHWSIKSTYTSSIPNSLFAMVLSTYPAEILDKTQEGNRRENVRLGWGINKRGVTDGQSHKHEKEQNSNRPSPNPPPASCRSLFLFSLNALRVFHAWRRSERADWPSDIQTYQHNNHVWFAYRVGSYRNMHKQTMTTLLGCRSMRLGFF